MSKNKVIVVLGFLVALLPTPFIGLPLDWEAFFQVVLGLAIVTLSIWSVVDKKLTLKAKAQKRQAHRRLIAEMRPEESETSEEEVVEEVQSPENRE